MSNPTARPDLDIDGAHYTWVGYSDQGDATYGFLADGILFASAGDRPDNLRREANPSGVRNAVHPGGCDACGQQGLRYRHFFRHDPSGDVIVLGDQCVAKMDFSSITDYAAARRVAARREAEAGKAAAAKWLAEQPEEVAAALALAEEHHILGDMAQKLQRYGSLSEKQVAFALRLADETRERLAEPPEPDPEPVPAELFDGRVRITGAVLGTKVVDSAFGSATKCLVSDDRGFKVFGGFVANKGERVTFMARLESTADRCFAFYSRPTKIEIEPEEDDGHTAEDERTLLEQLEGSNNP